MQLLEAILKQHASSDILFYLLRSDRNNGFQKHLTKCLAVLQNILDVSIGLYGGPCATCLSKYISIHRLCI